jgi:hypothetical protein
MKLIVPGKNVIMNCVELSSEKAQKILFPDK